MAKYIVEIPDEIEIKQDSQLVPFDMCRPSWWEEAYELGKKNAERKPGKCIHYCPMCGCKMKGGENMKTEDDEQREYLLEWNRRKKIKDAEKANKKQRKKENRRQWWNRITGRR